jgi:hypothetical protein
MDFASAGGLSPLLATWAKAPTFNDPRVGAPGPDGVEALRQALRLGGDAGDNTSLRDLWQALLQPDASAADETATDSSSDADADSDDADAGDDAGDDVAG